MEKVTKVAETTTNKNKVDINQFHWNAWGSAAVRSAWLGRLSLAPLNRGKLSFKTELLKERGRSVILQKFGTHDFVLFPPLGPNSRKQQCVRLYFVFFFFSRLGWPTKSHMLTLVWTQPCSTPSEPLEQKLAWAEDSGQNGLSRNGYGRPNHFIK